MSSSYSPDLRIELIGTGDQAGVWGNTTNTNLGTLLENAIAGYTSVAIVTSPQALTANDGAADEARFAALALTTTTGANFTVCIPPNSKLYTFYNASSFTATITNSTVKNGIIASGGSTINIPAGRTMSVWSDGTNVIQQTDNLISPTMTSPAMSGTPTAPTASAGTSTTQIATTAFMATMYPVGCIYTSTSGTNPASLFGFGTWVAYGAGRVLLGAGGGYSAGATGGSADAIVVSHTHTYSATTGNQSADHIHNVAGTTGGQSADHHHGIAYGPRSGGSAAVSDSGGGAGAFPTYGSSNDHSHNFNVNSGGVSSNHNHSVSGTTDSTGASGTNANLQPYVVVYMWNRTA